MLVTAPQPQNKGVHHLKLVSPDPDIFYASGIDRFYVVQEPRLRQHGIYLALYDSAVYVDRSGGTACPIASSRRSTGTGCLTRPRPVPPRLASRMVIKHPELTLLNKLPTGDRLDADRYEAADRFVTAFFLRVEQAGLLKPDASTQSKANAPDVVQSDQIERGFDGQGRQAFYHGQLRCHRPRPHRGWQVPGSGR